MSQSDRKVGPARWLWAALVFLLVLVAHAAIVSRFMVPRTKACDYLPIYLGSALARSGDNPYEVNRIWQARNAYGEDRRSRDLADDMPFSDKCDDCYYPPQLLLIVAPFARLSWSLGVVAWLLLVGGCGAVSGWLVLSFDRDDLPPRGVLAGWVGALVMLNPTTLLAMGLGQTGFLVTAGVIVGHLAMRRGKVFIGTLAWSLVGIKPQVAIAFVVLACCLEGPRKTLGIVAAIVGFNVLACVASSGRISLLFDYVGFIKDTQDRLPFNKAESPYLVSWNHVYYIITGLKIQPSVEVILAGLAAWGFLIHARLKVARQRWTPAFGLAATSVGAVLCGRAHGYDMVLLLGMAPWLVALWEGRARAPAIVLMVLIGVSVSVPQSALITVVDRMRLGEPWRDLVLAMRSIAVVALAGCILLTGVGTRSGQGPIPRAGSLAEGRADGP